MIDDEQAAEMKERFLGNHDLPHRGRRVIDNDGDYCVN